MSQVNDLDERPKLLEANISPKAYQIFNVLSPDISIVLEFFAVFSRFECALKSAGFYKPKTRGCQRIKPDWNAYADDLEKIPIQIEKINDAAEYLLTHPPKIQIGNKEIIDWEIQTNKRNMSKIRWIFTLIRSVRNNLFHGGKYIGQDHHYDECDELERNKKLLQASLKVLDICLGFDGGVKIAFNKELHS